MPRSHGVSQGEGAPAGAGRAVHTWHAQPAEVALAALGSRAEGLAAAEAAERLRREGPNRLPQGRRRGPLLRLAMQFNNLLIYVLLAAAALSFALGHVVDALVILGVVLINALVGFVQEGRAERALEAIRGMIDQRAAVLRDGHRTSIPAADLVRGDVVVIEAGDRVPADLRLLRARTLRIDEAILTGESVPVDKSADPVAPDAALGDRRSMAYSGAFVVAGQGLGVVTATGLRTELGQISTMLGTVEVLRTPLLAQMDRFARQVTLVVLGISALALVFAVTMRGYTAAEAFMAMVGLAVAAIPEGLPAVLTITLAIGVQRMAARKAIIRRLPAVETLGSVAVICTDKTGTLTRNEMTARAVVTAGARFLADGAGFAPHGSILREGGGQDPPGHPPLAELLRCAVLCNDAELRETEEGGWRIEGDPMEGALVVLARKAGIEPELLRRCWPRRDAIPFDAQHRFMATLHHDGRSGLIAIKGAPERIIGMCATERHADGERPIDAACWQAAAERLAAEGQRVLGFAARAPAQGQGALGLADVEGGATMLGLIGLIDPPREETVAAVAECRDAGIRVVMITGDHAVTARVIGRQLGLAPDPAVCTGRDLDALDPAGLRRAIAGTAVFARTTPEHKLRLVTAFQAEGLTVAMTGDGVNDAPALKRADVGVAMGIKGTEVSKEAAGMVLADDNFASIVAAVREGRTVYDNIRKLVAWILPTNGGEALTILAALGLGWTMPVTPVQILWVNMVTDVTLGLTLAFEPAERGSMRRPPRPRDEPILSGSLGWQILLVSVFFLLGTFGAFYWSQQRGMPLEASRTLVVNTLVALQIFYLFSVRYVHGPSLTWQGVLGTRAVLTGVGVTVLAQLAFTYLPPLQAAFGTLPLSPLELAVAAGIGVALLLAAEAEKRLRGGAG